MSHDAEPLWMTYLWQIVTACSAALLWLARATIRLWRTWRAVQHAVKELLDERHEALRDDRDQDADDLRERAARRKTLLDQARNRLRLARGQKLSAPSSAASDEDEALE